MVTATKTPEYESSLSKSITHFALLRLLPILSVLNTREKKQLLVASCVTDHVDPNEGPAYASNAIQAISTIRLRHKTYIYTYIRPLPALRGYIRDAMALHNLKN